MEQDPHDPRKPEGGTLDKVKGVADGIVGTVFELGGAISGVKVTIKPAKTRAEQAGRNLGAAIVAAAPIPGSTTISTGKAAVATIAKNVPKTTAKNPSTTIRQGTQVNKTAGARGTKRTISSKRTALAVAVEISLIALNPFY